MEAIRQYIEQGNFARAMELADASLEREPASAELWHIKGIIFRNLGNAGQAIGCFNKALGLKPDYREACSDLAAILTAAGHFEHAVKMYGYLLKIDCARPTAPLAQPIDKKAAQEWFGRGEEFYKKGDLAAALDAFGKVLELNAGMSEARSNLGLTLHRMRRYAEAEDMLLYCLRLQPKNAQALNALGGCYKDTGNPARAIAMWLQALAVKPDYEAACVNLGNIYSELKHMPEAVKYYEQALAQHPRNTLVLANLAYALKSLCEWQKAAQIIRKIEKLIKEGKHSFPPFVADILIDSPSIQLTNAKRYALEHFPNAKPYDPEFSLPSTGERLRIGYLSGDFHDHATTRLIGELFERHDTSRFDVFAFSYGDDTPNPARARIEAHTSFYDISRQNDSEAAQSIRAQNIDILIDLKGYTQGHRFGIAALRPAPLQMHYLGFPGTSGSQCMDYFITDSIVSPQSADTEFSEKLIRLPQSYQINDRQRPLASDALSRCAYGLPDEALVLADFNNSYKITPEIFHIWLKVLKAVEKSVLWLSATHTHAAENLRRMSQLGGIDPGRLVFAPMAAHAEHLARYRHVDLVLDSSPVCGHTTTSDALWCGAPVLCMEGKTFISRVSASLLKAVGLQELVAGDIAAYEKLALNLASDKTKLASLRRHLEEHRMDFPLFDSGQTTRALEAAYHRAAELHRAKKPLVPFSVT